VTAWEISFVDLQIRHSGKAALRLEKFTANQHGHGRVMQSIKVLPHRCYRVSVWAKPESRTGDAFHLQVLAGTERWLRATSTYRKHRLAQSACFLIVWISDKVSL
jgi:hypothetical protein